MNVLMLNGSPRKNGNTVSALKALKTGLEPRHQVELLHAVDLKLKGCIACDGCKHNGGRCVLPDDGAMWMEKVAAADLIVFGTPVYWWGVSAQLKLALDKFYSKDEAFHTAHKKLGIVSVGAAELDDPEYRLISGQFRCIAEFLGWQLILDEAFSAVNPGDLAADAAILAELTEKGRTL